MMAGPGGLATILVVLSFVSVCNSVEITINTTLGLITGTSSVLDGNNIQAFLGIPYAESPTGQLRFYPPVKKVKWSVKLNATNYGPACPQPPGNRWMERVLPGFNNYREDCLTLNVFRKANTAAGSAVLVFLHGGQWKYGTGQLYDGSLLATKGIIVVTLNYRLGPLGFLGTGPKTTWAGNYGLKDQVMALQWVKDNIADYNGDPAKVTLGGLEVGGASASFHMLSPISGHKGLFSKVIPMNCLAPFRTENWNYPLVRPAKWAAALAANVSCTQAPVADMIKCLQGKTANELVSFDITSGLPGLPAVWRPFPDGSFLIGNPTTLWEQGKFKAMPMLAGRAGIPYQVPDIHRNEMGISLEQYEAAITNIAKKLFPKTAESLKNALFFQYRDWSNLNDKIALREQYNQLLGDMLYSGWVRAITVFTQRANNTSLYAYILNHHFKNEPSQAYLGSQIGDDALLLFGQEPNGVAWTMEDKKVRDNIMTMWADFVMTGNPSTTSGIPWTPYTVDTQQYLDIQENTTMASKYRTRQTAFWNVYRPQVVSTDSTPTPQPETTAKPGGGPKSEPEPGPYFIATWVLVGLAALLLLILVFYIHRTMTRSRSDDRFKQNGTVDGTVRVP